MFGGYLTQKRNLALQCWRPEVNLVEIQRGVITKRSKGAGRADAQVTLLGKKNEKELGEREWEGSGRPFSAVLGSSGNPKTFASGPES